MAEALSSASPDHSQSDEPGNQDGADLDNSNVREQDRYLPIANIFQIMKRALPAPKITKDAEGKSTSRGPKIAKEAKETMQESVSEFISFITSEACLICNIEKRKTINGDDLLWAMRNLGLDNYVETLTIYLRKYRESESGLKGLGLNKPGDQASGKKEGGGPSMSPGVQMGPGRVDGDGMTCMPAMSPGVQMGGGVDGEGMTCTPAMSPGVQMGPGGVDGDGMSYRQPHRMEPDLYQMQMSHQMPAAPGNQQWERSMAAPGNVQPDRYQMQMSHQMPAAPGNQHMERSMAAPGNVTPDRYQMQMSHQMPAAPGNQQLERSMAAPEDEELEKLQSEFDYF